MTYKFHINDFEGPLDLLLHLIKESEKISLEVIKTNINSNYVDFNKIKLGIREKLGKYLYNETECKPMILIVIQEI